MANPNKSVPMLIDRAPGHNGTAIDALLATNPRLEFIHFPTAEPELNPDKHVWKAARDHINHNHLIAKLSQLAIDFETCIGAMILT